MIVTADVGDVMEVDDTLPVRDLDELEMELVLSEFPSVNEGIFFEKRNYDDNDDGDDFDDDNIDIDVEGWGWHVVPNNF